MDVVEAINTFLYPERSQLLDGVRDLIVSYADTGGPSVAGAYFIWRQLGLGDESVANISIDTKAQEVAVEVLPVSPHAYFSTIYIAIWVRTAAGQVLFSQELRGNIKAEQSYVVIPFVKGSTVSISHLEPIRSELVNTDNQTRYPVEKIHVVRSLGDGRLQV